MKLSFSLILAITLFAASSVATPIEKMKPMLFLKERNMSIKISKNFHHLLLRRSRKNMIMENFLNVENSMV